MPGDQPQQFAGHIAGAAEHDRRRALASCADYLGFADVAQAQAGDDVIAEIRGTADGIERFDAHLLADDFDSDLIVGRGTGDHARLDAEALAQQFDAAPGGDRDRSPTAPRRSARP